MISPKDLPKPWGRHVLKQRYPGFIADQRTAFTAYADRVVANVLGAARLRDDICAEQAAALRELIAERRRERSEGIRTGALAPWGGAW